MATALGQDQDYRTAGIDFPVKTLSGKA